VAKRTTAGSSDFPWLQGSGAFAAWLRNQPLQWSTVIAVRTALRTLPLINMKSPPDTLSIFNAAATAQFAAKYPNSAISPSYISRANSAAARADKLANYAARAVAFAATAAAEVATARTANADAKAAYDYAAQAVAVATHAAEQTETSADILRAVGEDVHWLRERSLSFDRLVEARLWEGSEPPSIAGAWRFLVQELTADGDHWSVWIEWYNQILAGRRSTELEDAALTEIRGDLPWNEGRERVNIEIARRLGVLRPDPSAIEGISSPITISRKPDGRIGVEPGPFSLPTLPDSSSADHRNALTACRNRAAQLMKLASSPQFQGRSDYAEMLGDYLDWLPSELGTGNILLADGEARTLNKLFTAEESILSTAFASKLSVLLEDHIALRSFYPEVERHYQAVSTGRLIKPLDRDAVQAIQRVIRFQTPTVFDETVSPAIDEAAKPIPDIQPPLPEDMPPAGLGRPKPPNDPIAEADPRKSRSFIIASAYNRIWGLLQKGKDTAQAVEGWHKTYELLKPHIGPIIDFLRHFLPMDGSGGGSLPPTIGV
jgi:hypothetical protein